MLSWLEGFQLAAHVPVQYWKRPLKAESAPAKRRPPDSRIIMRYMPSAFTWYLRAAISMMGIHLAWRSQSAICNCSPTRRAICRTRFRQTRTAWRAMATLAFSWSTEVSAAAVSGCVEAWPDSVPTGSVVPASAAARAASAASRRSCAWRSSRLATRSLPRSGVDALASGVVMAVVRAVATMRKARIAIQLLRRGTTSFRRGFPGGSGEACADGAFRAPAHLAPHANAELGDNGRGERMRGRAGRPRLSLIHISEPEIGGRCNPTGL